METIIKQLGKHNIDIDNDYTDIMDGEFTDSQKVIKLAYLVGKCMGKIRCVQLDLIALNDIQNGNNSN